MMHQNSRESPVFIRSRGDDDCELMWLPTCFDIIKATHKPIPTGTFVVLANSSKPTLSKAPELVVKIPDHTRKGR